MRDPSAVAAARRQAAALARPAGLSAHRAAQLALVVTELATNLLAHGTGGQLVVAAREAPRRGLRVLALDRGPGIGDIRRARRDGYSTAGTPGIGLGAIGRAADLLDLYSADGRGTVVLAELDADEGGPDEAPRPEVAALALPKPGETVCGDAWAVRPAAGGAQVLLADGLGHGLGADAAAQAAVRSFLDSPPASPAATLHQLHDALRGTRGAAAAVAELDAGERVVRYAGVGNVTLTLLDERQQTAVNHNGTIGHVLRTAQEFTYPWAPGVPVVMHSDGLSGRWRHADYPGLAARPPGLVAGVLLRDHDRGRDDVTVLVAREAA